MLVLKKCQKDRKSNNCVEIIYLIQVINKEKLRTRQMDQHKMNFHSRSQAFCSSPGDIPCRKSCRKIEEDTRSLAVVSTEPVG
jgi:hypothetical protein